MSTIAGILARLACVTKNAPVSLTAKGAALREKSRCLGETLFTSAHVPAKRLIDLNREVRAFRDAVTDSLEHRVSVQA